MIKLLHLIDNTLQSQTAAKCDLLIHIGTRTLKYAVIDNLRDEIKAVAEYELTDIKSLNDLIVALDRLRENKIEFKYPFNKIKVSFDSYKYTFIPEELFEAENEHDYSKFINPAVSDLILTNRIKSANIRNIFAIDANFNAALIRIFNNPRIYNQASPFIQGIKKTNPYKNNNCLFIDLQTDHIEIAYLKNSEFILYNLIECVNADEFNYFLLNIIKELDLDLTDTKLILSGQIALEDDENYKRILKYFKDPEFADSTLFFRLPDLFKKLNPHTYFSLFGLNECE
jgi:hypothetical protein